MKTAQNCQPCAFCKLRTFLSSFQPIVPLLLAGLIPQIALAAPTGKAEHIVIVVWDGMRSDLVSPEHTPTLYQLSKHGVAFKNHHPVYISTTEVNGTALNTGVYPVHSGIIANKEYRPQIDSGGPVEMQDEDAARRGDLLTDNHYISVPTLAEIVQRAGFRSAVACTKSVALLFDRSNVRDSEAAKESVDFYKGHVLPHSAMSLLEKGNDGKPFPAKISFPNVEQDAWTTKALTRGLWENDVPKFSVLWMSDPDYSEHESAPGSPTSIAALESVDKDLATVLNTLEEKKIRDKTDVFVVSDHGFSTITRSVDVADELTKAGFNASKKMKKKTAKGDVLVVGLGGSVSLYVVGHDKSTIRKAAAFLQSSDFAGVIFSRLPIEGTFPLKQVRVNTPNAPDLLVSMKWSADQNKFGVPGMFLADSNKKGAHGSLSPFDMHNTLIAAGPDFRDGFTDELPTGNADLAPTILWILGIKPPQPMDGRILSEAIADINAPTNSSQKTIEASRDGKGFHWQQYLKVSTVGDAIYFDEGNGNSIQQ